MRKLSKLIPVLILSVCTTLAWGQATTSLRGTVTDASGSAVHGAQVTIVNSSTNFTRTTQSGMDGTYVFAELLPGTYNVVVEAKGFSRHEEKAVQLRVELPATLNVQLKVGTVAEVISVTSQPERRSRMAFRTSSKIPRRPALDSIMLIRDRAVRKIPFAEMAILPLT